MGTRRGHQYAGQQRKSLFSTDVPLRTCTGHSTNAGCLQTPVCVYVCVLSHVQLFVTPWAVACQVPLSMGFSRQEYWHGLPFPSPRDLPNPGIKPGSSVLAGRDFTTVIGAYLAHLNSQSWTLPCAPCPGEGRAEPPP